MEFGCVLEKILIDYLFDDIEHCLASGVKLHTLYQQFEEVKKLPARLINLQLVIYFIFLDQGVILLFKLFTFLEDKRLEVMFEYYGDFSVKLWDI